ncbi:hypothetical protein Tco_0593663 [Tanacetum coccineum]
MNPIVAQQTALDNALVTPDDRVKIGKYNKRINPSKTPKEPTYQVVLDALALSPCYPAFLITADICPRLQNQEFDEPPSDEEIVSFIKELGYKGDIRSVTEFVSKTDEYETYGALIPVKMTNSKMWNSPSYKTYLAFAIGEATPKKARKFKKPASPSKKKTLIIVEEPVKKIAKKPAARRQPTGVQIKDTPGGSGDGAGFQLEVPNEPKGKSIDTHEGTGLKPGVPDVSKADSSDSEYESWGVSDDDDDDQQGDDERTEYDDDKSIDLNKTDDEEETQEDEFVHTPHDYVPTDDETDDLADEGKDDEEMTDAENVNTEHKNVNQEVAGDHVKDDAQETVTTAPTTQKTEFPLPSSSISSDYAAKFLNFDNIPSAETKIISMIEINVQHEDQSTHTSQLLNVPISVIPESLTAPTTTIPPPISPFIPLPQQSTPIRTPTNTKATISTTIVPDSTTLTTIHQRVSDLEKEVKILKDINHDSIILVTIKSEVPSFVKECLGTNLDDTLEKVIKKHLAEFIQEHSVPAAAVADAINKQLDSRKSAADIRKIKMEKAGKQQETKYTITSSDMTELQEFDQKRTLFETMTKTKSFNKTTKHRALYHALMESTIED